MTFRRRYGMPFGLVPKERPAATGRGCRAVVAARLLDPGKRVACPARAAARSVHDPAPAGRRRADPRRASRRPGDRLPTRSSTASTTLEVEEAYERDRKPRPGRRPEPRPKRRARRPRPTVRCASPRPRSCSSETALKLVAGGWQPILAYDVLLANLDPGLAADSSARDAAAASRALRGRADDRRGRGVARGRRGPDSRSRRRGAGSAPARRRRRGDSRAARSGRDLAPGCRGRTAAACGSSSGGRLGSALELRDPGPQRRRRALLLAEQLSISWSASPRSPAAASGARRHSSVSPRGTCSRGSPRTWRREPPRR